MYNIESIACGAGTCGISAGVYQLRQIIENFIKENKLSCRIYDTGCSGTCFEEPVFFLNTADGQTLTFISCTPKKIENICRKYLLGENIKIDPEYTDYFCASPFLSRQKRVVLAGCGILNPESLDDYRQKGGFSAFFKALEQEPAQIIEQIKKSGLRGRGGAGFPTGIKWELAARSSGSKKYLVCNADEGDPGAFMDRSVLEGDPFLLIEGMLIASYAIGADEGYIYCRAEYPLALKRINKAIMQLEKQSLLGKNICGKKHSFFLHVKEGAGAFVCGEETALMHSIEGKRGMPRLRPPFPAESGIFGCPTNINNVETLASVPYIITNGAEAYSSIGTEKSKGTKVFALAGKVKNTGLVEVPMGVTLRSIIFEIGGGIAKNRNFKAVQMGGPSGGCLPECLLDTPVDYEKIMETGAIVGSGGMIVLDDRTCMVDVAKYFLTFTQNESCGKCTYCRLGTRRMKEILEKISEGRALIGDLSLLEDLAVNIKTSSLCALGQSAPNPVLTTLRYF
ncbi:MAG: NADH dehydrogenase, partial [Spirochaetes bacterium GWF1_41_5]